MRGGRIGVVTGGWGRGRPARIVLAFLAVAALAAFEASTGKRSLPGALLPARTELPPAERAGVSTVGVSDTLVVGRADANADGVVDADLGSDADGDSDTFVDTEATAELAGNLGTSPGAAVRRRSAFSASGTPLAWRAIHDRVDGTLWRDVLTASAERQDESRSDPPGAPSNGSPPAARLPSTFHGVGFPALERVVSLPEERRREWMPLVMWSEPADPAGNARVPLPHVRCMGLSPEAVARRAARVESDVLALSTEHGVSASLVKALIAAESCFDPEAVSSVGAIGLMQLMPATADWLGAGDPADVLGNLDGGIRYLASLQERFGDTELALAAYNAGPGNVRRHGGVPPFAETRAYVRKVMAFHRRYVAATELVARLGAASPEPARSGAARRDDTR